jgi:hypothetical protein
MRCHRKGDSRRQASEYPPLRCEAQGSQSSLAG